MEMFAILLSVPVAFIGTAVLVQVLDVLSEQPLIARPLLWSALVILPVLAIEWLALLTIGPVGVRELVGPRFYGYHVALFFLALPALTTALTLGVERARLGSWLVIPILCAILAGPLALGQYWVAEALFGIDGSGGPYGDATTLY